MKRWTYKQRAAAIITVAVIECIGLRCFSAWRIVKLQYEWKSDQTAMVLSGIAVIVLSVAFNLLLALLHKELRPHIKKVVNIAIYIYRFMAFLGYLIVPIVCNKIFVS